MQFATFLRRHAHSGFAALALLACAAAANGTDTYSGGTLTIPSVSIGSATFTNMVVVVGSIVTPPSGTTGNGTSDTYDPATNRLTVPNVVVGTTTYHNAVVTVASLTSVASVAGADVYNAPNLSIASVQVGSVVYHNVTVTVGGIVGVAGGMPTAVRDTFSGGRLTIPAVQVGGRAFTNATITVGSILSVGGVEVPGVVGLTQAAATTALAAAHLVVGTVSSATSPTVPAGSVISQSPGAGATASLGSAVNLVVSTGSGGGGGGIGTGVGWIPFIAAPAPGKTPAGQSGLFVLPPDPLAATEANVSWVIPNKGIIAVGAAYVLKGLTPGSGFWPYAGIYAALDASNVVEIYQVNLTNSSTSAPAAVPVGNFVAKHVTALNLICDSRSGQTNILDPTSWFVVLHIGASNSCGTSTATGDSWVVVTATTTTTVNIATTKISLFYNPGGLLTAMVLNDPATHDILMYADKSFTAPATLFTGATTDLTVHAERVVTNSGFVGNGTVEFRELGNGSGTAVYRLDYTGAASFKAIPSYNPGTDTLSQDNILVGTKADAGNFYFTDASLTGQTVTLYQEPIGAAGSTPTAPIALYSAPLVPGFSVLGSNGSVVVLESVLAGNPSTSSLGTVPVGVAHTAAPSPLGPQGGFTGSIATSQMLDGTGSDLSHSALFINLTCAGAKCTPSPTHPDSTEILSLGNTPLQALTPNSQFLRQTNVLSQGYVLQIRGVTDTALATDGGGKLYAVPSVDNAGSYDGLVFESCLTFNAGSCATTGDYVVPANSSLPAFVGLSSAGNATGLQYDVPSAIFSGVVGNVTQQRIGVIGLTNTNIQFAY